MKLAFSSSLAPIALLAILGAWNVPAAHAGSTADEIRNCAPENWCAYHRTVDSAWRHSPLDQINKENVRNLHPAWIFQPGGEYQGMHSTPLVIDGAMYVPVNPSNVYKINAATGARDWVFAPELDEAIVARSFFAHTRGIAVGDGKLFVGTADGRLMAVDEQSGKPMWESQLVDSAKDTAGFSGAGTFVRSDLLVIGQNGGEYPVEGRIFGINPETGEVKWTFYTTGRNDPKALATWKGDSWKWGGGGSWQPGTVDYANNQIIMGVGNPNPDYDYCGKNCRDVNAEGHRPGDNLYTSSTVALDLDTGKLNWYFQEAPSDAYDYDAALGEYVLFTDQQGRDLILHPGKNGFNHVHDRKTGEPINIYPDMKSYNWTSGYDMQKRDWQDLLWPEAGKETLVCPAIDGGHSWNAGTYNPDLGLFYRIANEWCMKLTVNPPEGGATSAGTSDRTLEPFAQPFFAATWIGADPPGDKTHGRLTARDPVSGDIKWEKRYDIIPHSALLSTASGLLFLATYDGWLQALDGETGEVLWQFNLGSGSNGGIISYAADGKQYIAVVSGHGSYVGRVLADHYHKDRLQGYQEGRLVVAFALD
jgi:PQQ-dependent dehydrogenase (methanol/ethanol family)